MSSKQQGATLFTALVFLVLMTIVSVSAAKISMLDVLISGNNQQEMVLFQKTDRDLNEHSKPAKLITLLIEDEGTTNNYRSAWDYDYAADVNNPHTDARIGNRVIKYSCGAIGGLATSQGSDNSCRLFDFDIKNGKENSSAQERHVRGAGKEYPSICRNNFNC